MKCIHLIIENTQNDEMYEFVWMWLCGCFYPILDEYFSQKYNKNKTSSLTIENSQKTQNEVFKTGLKRSVQQIWITHVNVYTPTQHAHKLCRQERQNHF